MALLAGTLYDPAGKVSFSMASVIAMTAIDTTNLRLSFTVPANGAVLVRISVPMTGSTTPNRAFLGVLEGSTVRMRAQVIGTQLSFVTTDLITAEATAVVSGLTPGANLT